MIIIRLFSRSLLIRANHNNSWPVNRRNNLSSFAYIRLNLIMCVCLKVDKDFLPDSEWRWRDNQEMTSAGTDQEISETSLYPKMIIIASGWPIIMTSNRSRLQIVTKGDLFPLNKSPQTESDRKRNRWWTQHGTGMDRRMAFDLQPNLLFTTRRWREFRGEEPPRLLLLSIFECFPAISEEHQPRQQQHKSKRYKGRYKCLPMPTSISAGIDPSNLWRVEAAVAFLTTKDNREYHSLPRFDIIESGQSTSD